MEVVVNGTSSQCVFSRLYIFEVWCSKKGKGTIKDNQVFDEVVTHIEMEGTESMFCELSKRINYICSKLALMWRKNARLKSLVLKNHLPWLSIKEVVPLNEAVSLQNEILNSGLKRKRGRPKTDFSQSSKRTKQRRLAVLAENDESIANALRSAECEPKQVLMEVNITEVISLMMETNLTKHQYLLIREFINAKLSFSLLPSYEKVVKEKKKSYPDTITVNESCAEVELQSLLDHTASRILDLQSEVLDNINDNKVCKIKEQK